MTNNTMTITLNESTFKACKDYVQINKSIHVTATTLKTKKLARMQLIYGQKNDTNAQKRVDR